MRYYFSLVTALVISLNAVANPVELAGTQSVTIKQNAKRVAAPQYVLPDGDADKDGLSIERNTEQANLDKTIEVLKYRLSPEAKRALKARLNKIKILPYNYDALTLPSKVELAMSNVPVLDQGRHGSCVTFAVTGAFDAAIEEGNHISQLCNLSLGKYLEEKYGQPSGWSGSWGDIVLDQINRYGYISMLNQRMYKCGGLREYPRDNAKQTGKAMTPDQFAKRSLVLGDGILWDRFLTVEESMSEDFDGKRSLADAKVALASGHRVIIGYLLDSKVGHVGAVGSRHAKGDTWIMTPRIEDDLHNGKISSAHELIITGYDDSARVDGHKGILTLRNSWGKRSGDHGRYYMSYDYFEKMVVDAYRVYSRNDKPQY